MSDLDRQALAALVESRALVLTCAEAAAAGFTRSAVRWAVASGALVRLRAGAFTTSAAWQSLSPGGRHLLELRAAQRLNPDAVACGTSAAVVLGLPLPGSGHHGWRPRRTTAGGQGPASAGSGRVRW